MIILYDLTVLGSQVAPRYMGENASLLCSQAASKYLSENASLLCSEVASRYLCEDVSVEEAGEDETLGLGVPIKVRGLNGLQYKCILTAGQYVQCHVFDSP